MVKIFIGNVGDAADSGELQRMFEKYGTVQECDVLTNFAFVHMEDEGEATSAIEGLDGALFAGGIIKVQMSHGKSFRGTRGGFRGFGRGGGDRGDRGGFRGRGGASFRGNRDDSGYRSRDDGAYRGRDDGVSYRPREREDISSRVGFRDRERVRERYDDYAPPREREYYPRHDPYERDLYHRDLYARPDPYARDLYARDPYERRPPPREYYERRTRDPYASYTTARDPYPATRDPYGSRALDRLDLLEPYPPPRERSPLGAREYSSSSRRPYEAGYEIGGRSGSPAPRRY